MKAMGAATYPTRSLKTAAQVPGNHDRRIDVEQLRMASPHQPVMFRCSREAPHPTSESSGRLLRYRARVQDLAEA